MKKLIALLLVVVFVCSAFVGCDWLNFFDNETSLPNGVVESTITDISGNSITFAHSDNFTQDDIDFVAMICNESSEYISLVTTKEDLTLEKILYKVQNGEPLFLMNFQSPYIICAYLKPDKSELDINSYITPTIDITNYIWYKFTNTKSIPDSIEGMTKTKRSLSYLLYDCTIISDVVEKIEYNKKCKYYLPYVNEASFDITSNNMLVYYSNYSAEITESTFLGKFKFGYTIYTDEHGTKYLTTMGEEYIVGASGELDYSGTYADIEYGVFYKKVHPYFVYFSQLDAEYEYHGKTYILHMDCIKIEDLINAIK